MEYIRNNLVWSLLDKHLSSGRGEAVALRSEARAITYQELSQQVMHFIAQHQSFLDAPKGTLVMCLLEDSIESVVALLALMRLGLIPCIVNPNLTDKLYDDYLEIAKPGLVFSSTTLTVQPVGEAVYPSEITPVTEEAGAFGLFTSGTTGRPNLIIHRHQDPLITVKNYVQNTLQIESKDVIFSTSKLFFAYGLNSLFFALIHGATAILSPKNHSLEKIWHIITHDKPSLFFSVPTQYLRLLEHEAVPECIKHVRLCISAGEHLPASLHQRWQAKFNLGIIDGIGTTEMLSTFITNTPKVFRNGSTGQLVPGFQAEIRDEKNEKVAMGEIGILWIKGETYPCCYVNHAAISNDRFVEGWFKTYDLFSMDADGFYYYHGRASDLIKCGGVWIFPHHIEAVLNQHPQVLESAVVGEYQHGLLRPVAYVVLKTDHANQTLMAELKKQCKEKCSKHEYPHMIYVVNEIPKTATGKLQRYLLRTKSPLRENSYDTTL